MKYASTMMIEGTETVVVVLPLAAVPFFDPASPPQDNTYAVPDNVQVGWVVDGAGGFVTPPHVMIPQSVTRRQFKLALLSLGLLDEVEAAIAASADRALQINWADALDFVRSNPFIATMAAALNKTDTDIDGLFQLAAAQ